jgi:putative holliday junction resolvase
MPKYQRVLGFDFGEHRIGVASGQMITQTATPVCILSAKQGKPNWDELAKLIQTWKPDCLVFGLALHKDGSPSDTSKRTEKFAQHCAKRFKLPIEFVNESLSSKEVLARIETMGLKKRDHIDDLAACVILETWMGTV